MESKNKKLLTMTPRERILAAVTHKPTDRFPTDIWATPEVWEKLHAHFKTENNLEIYDQLGIDGIIGIGPEYIGPTLHKEDGYFENEWSMGYSRQKYETGEYYEQTYYPLAEAVSIDDLKRFSWPRPEWYDYDSLLEQAAKYPNRAIMTGYAAIFYYHNMLRGLEKSMMDPALEPEFTHYLINKIAETFYEVHLRSFKAAGDVIDFTQVTDDFGSQNSLLISPLMFDDFYRKPMQEAIDLAKSFDIYVFHHDDGDIRKLLPRLADMKIDLLNPIQWRCGNWDLDWLKIEFGDHFCFHGAVDNQQTLPFGTQDDVVREVRWIKSTLGKDGTGLIIGPCHNIQANTPIENIIAMYETAIE